MTRTDGEEELVLGNKQLLSAFFIVVVLLGVFFTMGYIIGRNTATVTTANSKSDARPATPRIETPPETTASKPAVQDITPAQTPDSTQPAKPYEERRPQPAASDAAAAVPPAPVNISGQLYLQAFALKRPDADNMVKVLKERGFPALLGESPKEGYFRVLVGPFSDIASLRKSKDDLKSAGFDSVIAK
jgi:cell division septation protein DedD